MVAPAPTAVPEGKLWLGHLPPAPTTFAEAMAHPVARYWAAAMKREKNEIRNHETWDETIAPEGVRIIKGRWVFAYRTTAPVEGYLQRKEIDYFQTTAPVAKIDTIRFHIALAAQVGKHESFSIVGLRPSFVYSRSGDRTSLLGVYYLYMMTVYIPNAYLHSETDLIFLRRDATRL